MTTTNERLTRWIAARAGVAPDVVADDTPLLERGLLDSLGVVDLLLWLEEEAGASVDPARIAPGAFRDVRSIAAAFLAPGSLLPGSLSPGGAR